METAASRGSRYATGCFNVATAEKAVETALPAFEPGLREPGRKTVVGQLQLDVAAHGPANGHIANPSLKTCPLHVRGRFDCLRLLRCDLGADRLTHDLVEANATQAEDFRE